MSRTRCTSTIGQVQDSVHDHRAWTVPREGLQPLDNQGEGVYDGTLSVTDVEDVSAVVTFTGTRVSVYGSLRAALAPDVPSPLTKYSIPEWDYGGVSAITPYQAPSTWSSTCIVEFAASALYFHVGHAPSDDLASSKNHYCDGSASAIFPSKGRSNIQSACHIVPGKSVRETVNILIHISSCVCPCQRGDTSGLDRDNHIVACAMVGAAVGGALLLLVALLALYTCIRRRRYAIPAEYDYGEGTVAQKDPEPHITPFVDPSFGVGMVQAGDRGIMFVPARDSMNSQSTRPTSPPASPYSKSRTVSPQPQPDPRTSGGEVSYRTIGHKRSMTFQSVPSDRPLSPGMGMGAGPSALDPMSSRPSSRAVNVPPGIEVLVQAQQPSVEGSHELPPPVYSASPRPDENYSVRTLSRGNPGAVTYDALR
ncbi:hypothetical protein C8T65DRAFT_730381 [Cerioporus squamosus]|nr:hypothetical protein C8T65DRAFT_730381 [Cerioporus squamosus]